MANEVEVQEEVKAPVLFKFTNQEESGQLDSILAMFYQGIYDNSVGIMSAFNLDEGREELILVGVHLDADGKAECYPLAKIFAMEDTLKYLSPDGKGGYFDPRNPAETAEAKENMRSFSDAVVDTNAAN